jgi:hypothetical protein
VNVHHRAGLQNLKGLLFRLLLQLLPVPLEPVDLELLSDQFHLVRNLLNLHDSFLVPSP